GIHVFVGLREDKKAKDIVREMACGVRVVTENQDNPTLQDTWEYWGGHFYGIAVYTSTDGKTPEFPTSWVRTRDQCHMSCTLVHSRVPFAIGFGAARQILLGIVGKP